MTGNPLFYGRLTWLSGYWQIEALPHVLLRLRRLFPRAVQKAGPLHLKDTGETCVEIEWVDKRWTLEMTPELRARLEERAEQHRAHVEQFSQVLEGSIPPRPVDTALPLRSYQQTAVELAIRAGGLLVGDELGVGKTAIGIGLIAYSRPAVVVTMTHLPLQWARELRRFLPGARVHIARKGTPYDVTARGVSKPWRYPENELDQACFPDVFVLSYSKLAGWSDTLRSFVRTVVFDEVHELRTGRGTAKYDSAMVLARDAEYRLGMTATPVFNYGYDMFNLISPLRPGELGGVEEFKREWCTDDEKPRIKDPPAFGAYLRTAGLYLRRTRADVGRELPELTIAPIELEVDDKPLKEMEGVAAELARKILASPGPERWTAAGEFDWRLRQATGIAKAPAALAFVTLLLEQEPQVVLVGWHKAVYDLWTAGFDKAGIRWARYTGDESLGQKDANVQAFIAGKVQVLILSLRAGAGLDGLQDTSCASIVFGELDWSPQVHRQNIGRLHRDGQTKRVTAYYLLSSSGSDPVVADVLELKRQQALGVEDPDQRDLAPVADRERAVTLARRYLESIGQAVPETAPSTEVTRSDPGSVSGPDESPNA